MANLISPFVTLAVEDRIAWVSISNTSLNILSTEVLQAITAAVAKADEDPSVAVVALRGSGDRAFSAGADIHEHNPEAEDMHRGAMFDMIDQLIGGCGKPRIAAVRGLCFGGGVDTAFSCDIVVASEDARFAMPEIKLGVMDVVGARVLMSHITPARAIELATTGETIGVERAYQLGMVSQIFPSEGFDEAVREYVASISQHSISALTIGRRVLHGSQALDRAQAIQKLRHAVAHEIDGN